MIRLRPSSARGHFDFGWLNTYHTFSFGDYHDRNHMAFRSLRVINEDVVAPGRGFGEHPHRDMEIITYIITGALAHGDNMGNKSTIVPGDVQRMTAGTGVMHSEKNPSPAEPVHLLQIWIMPDRRGHEPGYEQKNFATAQRHNRLHLVASPDGAEGSVSLHQDARIYAAALDKGTSVAHTLKPGRGAWVQLIKGELSANGTKLSPGDGAAVEDETNLALKADSAAEFLLFDLA